MSEDPRINKNQPRRLGTTPAIHPSARVNANCVLGAYTEVGERVHLSETVLGDYSYIVDDSRVIYSEIGKFCSIAAQTRINPGNHPMWRAAQHHFSYRARQYGLAEEDDAELFEWRRRHRVALGHDVWLGHGVVVLPGVSIGSGAAVGAGSVVTRDVPPYMVVAGVPARTVRRRVDERTAEKLLALAWWDWGHEQLRAALADFRALDAVAFVEKYAR